MNPTLLLVTWYVPSLYYTGHFFVQLIYNHEQKQLRHSSKKTCFVKRVSFSISNFHFSTPSPLFNVVTTWQCQRSVFQHWKGGEGHRCFLNLRKDADKKRLFCSNVSKLLSMIVAILLRKKSCDARQVAWIVLHRAKFLATCLSMMVTGAERSNFIGWCVATQVAGMMLH